MSETHHLEQIVFIKKNNLATPVTFFDERHLHEALKTINKAMGNDTLIYYALKSCYNKEILKTLSISGLGAEVLSEFEYNLAVETGFNSILLNGMGRSHKLLARAVADDNTVIVDTLNDIKNLSQIAKVSDNTLRIGFRLRLNLSETEPNNSYVSEQHPLGNYLESNFVAELLKFCLTHENVKWEMLHVHLTINETSSNIYKEAVTQLAVALQYLELHYGLKPNIINLGGGFEVFDPELKPEFVKLFKDIKQSFNVVLDGYRMAIEPGRYLSAYAGYTIGKVLDIKQLGNNVRLPI
jgi:diaminopimelate decarboxylase